MSKFYEFIQWSVLQRRATHNSKEYFRARNTNSGFCRCKVARNWTFRRKNQKNGRNACDQDNRSCKTQRRFAVWLEPWTHLDKQHIVQVFFRIRSTWGNHVCRFSKITLLFTGSGSSFLHVYESKSGSSVRTHGWPRDIPHRAVENNKNAGVLRCGNYYWPPQTRVW